MTVLTTTEPALGGVLFGVEDWPVVISIGGRVDLASEVRADLKNARARERMLVKDLALLEASLVPWSEIQEQLPSYERVAQYNVFLASTSRINRTKLWIIAVRRQIEELKEELLETQSAGTHP